MTKPKVNTNPVANKCSGPNERIIEYSSNSGGGLIAFRETDDGRLVVDLYRHDETVDVRVGPPEGVPRVDQVLITLPDGQQVGKLGTDEYHIRRRSIDSWALPLEYSTHPHVPNTVYFGEW